MQTSSSRRYCERVPSASERSRSKVSSDWDRPLDKKPVGTVSTSVASEFLLTGSTVYKNHKTSSLAQHQF